MKILKPYYYDEFSCIGSKCQDNCCAGWNINIDKKSLEIYNNIPGEFGDKLKNSIVVSDKTKFKLNNSSECPFLNEEKLCDIYINIGADKLCDTCKVYPRVIMRYDDVYEYNLTLSCPEVARILVACNSSIDYCFGEEDIKNDSANSANSAKNDYLFNALIKARGISVDLMQMKEIPIWKKLFLCASIANKLQNGIHLEKFNSLDNLLEPFSNLNYIKNYVAVLDTLPQNKLLKREQYIELINTVAGLGVTNKKFNEYLKEVVIYINNPENQMDTTELLDYYYSENQAREYIFENFIVYSLFRYYMKAYIDKNLYEYIFLIVVGYALIRLLAAVNWYENDKKITLKEYEEILYSYSRTIEHSSEIIEKVYKNMGKKEYQTLASLAVLIH